MIFYHSTSQLNWERIQTEGVLWGIRNAPSRCTYLAVEKQNVKPSMDVILKVEYEPKAGSDNYVTGCWQIRVYDPIPLSDVELVEEQQG